MNSKENITLTIDGESVAAPKDATILQVMESLGNPAPVICYHEATTSEGICRQCVVEVEGWRVSGTILRDPSQPRDGDPHRK